MKRTYGRGSVEEDSWDRFWQGGPMGEALVRRIYGRGFGGRDFSGWDFNERGSD